MIERQRIRYGLLFSISLAMTWVLTNAVFAMALWSFRDQSAGRLAALASLWLFTVLAPTTTALRLHRRLEDLSTVVPEVPAAVVRELALMRSLLLILGTMAMLSAFTLLVRS